MPPLFTAQSLVRSFVVEDMFQRFIGISQDQSLLSLDIDFFTI